MSVTGRHSPDDAAIRASGVARMIAAVIARSEATKQSTHKPGAPWIASLALAMTRTWLAIPRARDAVVRSGALFHQVRAICVADLEILDRSTSLDSRDQPARLPAAARPRLGWHKGIAILRKHLWVFAARSEALQPVCALDGTLAVENGNTLLELAHPRDDPHGQDPAGAFVQRPEITYRHRYQFVFNDCHAATACFVLSSRPQYSP